MGECVMLLGIIAGMSLLSALFACAGTKAWIGFSWLWILPVSFVGTFLILAALVFVFVWAACAVVRLDVPQEKDSPFYRRMVYLLAEAALTIVQARVHTKGLEKTPKQGRFLLVCNHLNDLDPVTLLHFFNKSQLAFISKRENSSMFLVGKLMHKIMCQLVHRENDREALKTILKCIQLIREDQVSIAVFPEGYTSVTGKLQPFRHGVFKIAQKTQVPIVVCTLKNTQFVFHNALRLKPTDVHLHLLDVITPQDYMGQTAVELGERIHAMMLEDLGPEYAPAQENP